MAISLKSVLDFFKANGIEVKNDVGTACPVVTGIGIKDMAAKSVAEVTVSAHPDVPVGSLVVRVKNEFYFITKEDQFWSSLEKVKDYKVAVIEGPFFDGVVSATVEVHGSNYRNSIKDLGTKEWGVITGSAHDDVPLGSLVLRVKNEFLFVTKEGKLFSNSLEKVKNYLIRGLSESEMDNLGEDLDTVIV